MLPFIGLISFVGLIVFIVRAVRAKYKRTGKAKKMWLYAGGCFVIFLVAAGIDGATHPADNIPKQQATPVATVPKKTAVMNMADEQAKKNQEAKSAKQKANQEASQKKAQEEAAAKKKTAADNQAKKDKAAADAKAAQQAELAALGDWDIKSNSDDFANRYTQIQKYIALGDRQSAYDEATKASKRADDLNTETMNNQDMANVPKDIPSNVKDILNGVDPHLSQGYMLEKQGFDALADGINNNDLSKIDTAKENFTLANDEFNQAKALIDKANKTLK